MLRRECWISETRSVRESQRPRDRIAMSPGRCTPSIAIAAQYFASLAPILGVAVPAEQTSATAAASTPAARTRCSLGRNPPRETS
jgi:hypothetical protein